MTATLRVCVAGRGQPEIGGIPTFLDQLLAGPVFANVDFDFCNLATPPAPPSSVPATISDFGRTAKDAWRLARAAAKGDVVHIHSALAPAPTMVRAGVLALAARLGGARVVVHAHGGRLPSWGRSVAAPPITSLALAPAHRIVAVSDSVAGALGSLLWRRSTRIGAIPNGVDVDRFSPGQGHTTVDDAALRVLFVGRLTESKGLFDLLEASARLDEQGVDHELIVAGPSSDAPAEGDRLKRMVTARVKVLGPLAPDAMIDQYRRADVLCLPSWWEAAPLAVLEAMACGLPVVATRVGDVPKMVEDRSTGTLLPVGQPEGIADALAELQRNPDLRQRYGQAGRARVEAHFDLRFTHEQILALYEELAT